MLKGIRSHFQAFNPEYGLRFACSMLAKSSKHIFPNGGLVVIHHGRELKSP